MRVLAEHGIEIYNTDIEGDKCIILDNVDLQVAMAMYVYTSVGVMVLRVANP